MLEGQDGILNRIKRGVKIVRGCDVGHHLLCWFDTESGGWVRLGVR
jgi:hypothetical protein